MDHYEWGELQKTTSTMNLVTQDTLFSTYLNNSHSIFIGPTPRWSLENQNILKNRFHESESLVNRFCELLPNC